MVHEFGADEKTLEDIDLKAAPNSNGRFSKSDVTAENVTLPDKTPVLQYSFNGHPMRYRGPMLMESDVPWSWRRQSSETQSECTFLVIPRLECRLWC